MSKLSILKIATAYIQTLGAIIEEDDFNKDLAAKSQSSSSSSTATSKGPELTREAIENLTTILKQESRAKKKGFGRSTL